MKSIKIVYVGYWILPLLISNLKTYGLFFGNVPWNTFVCMLCLILLIFSFCWSFRPFEPYIRDLSGNSLDHGLVCDQLNPKSLNFFSLINMIEIESMEMLRVIIGSNHSIKFKNNNFFLYWQNDNTIKHVN